MIYDGLSKDATLASWLAPAETYARRNWPAVAACAIAGAVVLFLVYLYTRFALPPGTDAGQWLAVSRFYLGQHVPEGRSVATVPPVVPVLLAAFSVMGGSTGAIAGMAVLCYATLALFSYKLGERLTGSATGGLLAVVGIVVIQSQLFELLSMGAFPQLSAMVGMAVALYALLGLTKAPEDQAEWLKLAAGLALTLFSHTPSATVAIPVIGACLLYVFYSSDDRGATVRAAIRFLGPVFAAWCVFLFINRGVIFGYAGVDAAYELKGPDKLLQIVWKDNPQRIVFMAGLSATAALPLLFDDPESRRLRGRPSLLLAIWTSVLLAIVVVTAVRHTGTDYPRFIAYFIVPLGLAAAACVQFLKPSPGAVAALLVPALLFAGHDAMRHFDTATRFYGMNERSGSLRDLSAWLDTQGEDGGVIGGTRETKWLEALTGRDSLLYMPRIYITRPWEIERALEAEVVHRSSGGIETGRLLVTANDGGQDFGNVFPNGVRLDLFDDGLYVHCLTLRDQTTAVTFEAYGSTRKLSLASMVNWGTRAYEDSAGKHLATTFVAEDAPLSVVRIVTAGSEILGAVTVDYYVGAPPGVNTDSLIVGTGDSGPVEIKPGATQVLYPEFESGRVAVVDARTSWEGGKLPPQDANPMLTWRRATIAFDFGYGEHRVPAARLLDPVAILDRRNVQYIVDRDGDGAAFPIIRGLQLEPVYENSVYRLYEVPARDDR